MQQENDFILREIQKMTLFFIQLISQASSMKLPGLEVEINNISEELKAKIDLSISEIIELENTKLLLKINTLNVLHIEKITELIYEILKKTHKTDKIYGFDQKELALKNILLIKHLDHHSNTLSIKRIEMKNMLQQWIE